VLESRVRRFVYSNGYVEIERERLALSIRDTKVARPGLIVDLVSEDVKVLNYYSKVTLGKEQLEIIPSRTLSPYVTVFTRLTKLLSIVKSLRIP